MVFEKNDAQESKSNFEFSYESDFNENHSEASADKYDINDYQFEMNIEDFDFDRVEDNFSKERLTEPIMGVEDVSEEQFQTTADAIAEDMLGRNYPKLQKGLTVISLVNAASKALEWHWESNPPESLEGIIAKEIFTIKPIPDPAKVRDALQEFGQSAPEKVSASIDKFENLMAEKMYEYELQLMKLYRYH